MTSLTISGYAFQCVPLSDADFNDVAAIYVIICVSSGGSWVVIDVGQSGELGSRIDNHDRKSCWERKCKSGNIWVCVYKMPTATYTKADRLALEDRLRGMYTNLCGKR